MPRADMKSDLTAQTERGGVSVLFACTHNAVRSPMAAGLMAIRYGAKSYVKSAGVYTEQPVDPFAVAAMAELKVDITNHEPHSFQDIEADGEDLGSYDVLIALSEEAYEQALNSAGCAAVLIEYWPTPDPTSGVSSGSREQRLEAYRRVRDFLDAKITERFGA